MPAEPGYTNGMKTAVSIPDDVFEGAERLARRAGKSRSRLFTEALQEYVARHAPEEVTEAMNRVCTALPPSKDRFASAAARRTMERTEW
jgi:metal-responsive CopG/Arc/MetJ family transcriptional regulator